MLVMQTQPYAIYSISSVSCWKTQSEWRQFCFRLLQLKRLSGTEIQKKITKFCLKERGFKVQVPKSCLITSHTHDGTLLAHRATQLAARPQIRQPLSIDSPDAIDKVSQCPRHMRHNVYPSDSCSVIDASASIEMHRKKEARSRKNDTVPKKSGEHLWQGGFMPTTWSYFEPPATFFRCRFGESLQRYLTGYGTVSGSTCS